MQILNRYAYDVMVGRIQLSYQIPSSCDAMFLDENRIYFVETNTPFKRIKYEDVKFDHHRATQIKNSLYAINLEDKKMRFNCYTQNMIDRSLSCQKLRPCTHKRATFEMTSFYDGFILIIGGFQGQYMSNTFIYNINGRKWKEGPSLNVARALHSVCQHGAFIYTFGG